LENRLRVLRAVADFGHLTCAQVSFCCYPQARYPLQLAQRSIARCVREGLLILRTNCHGGRSFVISRRGAALLEVHGTKRRHGLDLRGVKGPTFTHHSLTNAFVCKKRGDGFAGWSEYGIVNGHAPFSAHDLMTLCRGKLCDAVICKGTQLWLCETESARKAHDEVLRVVGLSELVGKQVRPDLPFVVAGVIIVFDSSFDHAKPLAKAARARWSGMSELDKVRLASCIILCRVKIALPQVWCSSTEAPLQL
jgi:hypothetical protein